MIAVARQNEEVSTMVDDVQWFAGIDWATQSHRVALLDLEGRHVSERDFAHDGAGLAELRDWLLEMTKAAPGQIAVAIETPHGPVVEMLLDHGFLVFAINPKQLDRFRDRFTVAGAKDDSRDARVLGSGLRTDRHAFRQLAIQNPLVIELREWSRMADELQQERTRLANRIRQQLWRYYPQAVELTDDVADDWYLALWQQVPTPAAAVKASQGASHPPDRCRNGAEDLAQDPAVRHAGHDGGGLRACSRCRGAAAPGQSADQAGASCAG
jgi:Transposase